MTGGAGTPIDNELPKNGEDSIFFTKLEG